MSGYMVKRTAALLAALAVVLMCACAFAFPAFAEEGDLVAGEVGSSSEAAPKADADAEGDKDAADENAEPEKEAEPEVASVAVYRLYNPWSGEHLYTLDADERDSLVPVGWSDEGEAWQAPETSEKPVYRLYNPFTGDHHYTLSKGELESLTTQGWKPEGVVWYSDEAEGQTLFRLYNPNAATGAHHYTSSVAEVISLVARGWMPEGAGWYGLAPESEPEPVPIIDPETLSYSPVYRLYFAVRDNHLYTAWKDERNNLTSGLWHYEGAAWQSPSDGDPVYRLFNPYSGEYMFTADYEESGNLARSGWSFEGIGMYSCVEADESRVPVFRLFNAGSGKHHFTVAEGERDALVGAGWSDEGTAFYARPLAEDFQDDMELWYPHISGDAGFDAQLEEIIYYHAGDLRSAYDYVVGFSYRSGERYWSGPHVLDDATTKDMAQDMIAHHSGNCYRFASLFSWLARGLGYSTNVISGWVPSASGGAAPHGWVEVYIDGETYICDPDLQHEIGGGWYMRTYSNPPTSYGSW